MPFAFEKPIEGELKLTEFQQEDESALIELLDHPGIYQTTLRIPSPYTVSDAQHWIGFANKLHAGFDQITNWAIRDPENQLLGGISFILTEGIRHRGEIGYWIGRPYWGRGIATRAVAAICQMGFERFQFSKITALVFATNPASDRVLIKNGFTQEGFLPRHFCKDGVLIDGRIYGLLRE